MSYPFVEPPSDATLPPLRIHHFMLWTAVSAVMMTVANTDATVQTLTAQNGAGDIPATLIGSLSLTGLLLGFYWKRLGCCFFDEPGQMAFIIQSWWTLYGLVSMTVAAYLANGGVDVSAIRIFSGLLGLGGLVVGLITLALYFRYANKFKHYGRWGKFFKAVGVIMILQFLFSFVMGMVLVIGMQGNPSMQYLFLAPALVPLFFGIVEIIYWVLAVREDLREQTVYHWTHWVGASTWPLLRLAGLFSTILLILDPPDWSAL